MLSDDSDDSDEEESEKITSECKSAGTYDIGMGGFSCGSGFTLGVTLYDNESCGGDGESLVLS